MPEKPCIIITRPKEDAESTASLLARHGFDYFIEPAITIENIPSAQNELENTISKYEAIVITSRNAARALTNITPGIKIISIGKSTSSFLSKQGFINVEYAGKNVTELCQHLKSNYKDKPLVYASGESITRELNGENCGFNISRMPVYRTIPVSTFSKEFKEKLIQGEFNGVLFFSKKTAETFYKNIIKERLELYIENLYAFCFSYDIAKLVTSYGFKATMHPKNPNIEEIINLLVRFRFS